MFPANGAMSADAVTNAFQDSLNACFGSKAHIRSPAVKSSSSKSKAKPKPKPKAKAKAKAKKSPAKPKAKSKPKIKSATPKAKSAANKPTIAKLTAMRDACDLLLKNIKM